jgi:DNA-binding LacI/PurR family transcriptional regulator
MPKEKITIKDVARIAGVSTQTVSRVLNNREYVSADTRTRVQGVISALGYSPNVYARNLSRGRSSTIGVIGHGLVYFGSSSVITGIERKANDLGFNLTLSLVDHFDPTRVDRILYDLLSLRVEGIIWAVPANFLNFGWLAKKLSKINTPVVYINKGPSDSDYVSGMDNRLGGKLAAEHLMEQGYRQVGIITGPLDWWEAQERLAGWRTAVAAAGHENIDSLIFEGDWDPLSGDVGLHTLIEQNPNLDALFISNDQMALGALQATRRLGLRVPEDLGIVGFDDIPEAEFFFPPLTTIRQNMFKLGAQAVEQISSLIQAQASGKALDFNISWLKPRLIVRDSSLKSRGLAE